MADNKDVKQVKNTIYRLYFMKNLFQKTNESFHDSPGSAERRLKELLNKEENRGAWLLPTPENQRDSTRFYLEMTLIGSFGVRDRDLDHLSSAFVCSDLTRVYIEKIEVDN